MNRTSYSTRQIAELVGGVLVGSPDLPVHGAQRLDAATAEQISFINDASYAGAWSASRACAALINKDIVLEPGDGRALIRVSNADLAMAAVLKLFAPPPAAVTAGIHPTAIVDSTAKLAPGVSVGPHCFIGPRAVLGEGTVLHANVCIYDDCVVGSQCVIWSGCVIRERCQIGDHCILHPQVTIGADGFGYRPSPDGQSLVKIPQIGDVKIGNHVEIGASACIDRGKFSSTVIGDHTKIDNLCQIAHNCTLGQRCVLAAQVGLAGSVTLGDDVQLGGQVGIADHLTIGAGAIILAQSGVISNVPAGETWFGYPADNRQQALRRLAALRKLPDLIQSLRDSRS